jgi:hypothetical protein
LAILQPKAFRPKLLAPIWDVTDPATASCSGTDTLQRDRTGEFMAGRFFENGGRLLLA